MPCENAIDGAVDSTSGVLAFKPVAEKPKTGGGAAHAHPLAPQQLTRVLVYIDANIGRDIALIDLAQLVGVSRDHFIRCFRAATTRRCATPAAARQRRSIRRCRAI
jgi:transcriptional regulator GlxA family with amidase domain